MKSARRRWGLVFGATLLVALLVGGRWLALETAERAWAATIPGGDVYLAARQLARLVGSLVLVLSVAWGTGNLYFVYRAIGSVQMPRRLGDLEIVEAVPQRVLLAGTLASGLVFGIILALGTGRWWLEAALAANPPAFGVADPVLHRDLGYYVGQLPWARTRQGYALLATTTATIVVALLYSGIGSLRFKRWRPLASPHARAHLSVLLACLALALAWGALLDPAEVVAGLHGALDRPALELRVPGAAFVAALGLLVAAVSLAWGWWDKPDLLAGGWAALLVGELAVYLFLPAIARSAAPAAGDRAHPSLAAEQRRLERLAFGTESLQGEPPGFATVEAALAALPVWDPDRVAAVARRSPLMAGQESVAGIALSTHRLAGGRATWLVPRAPDAEALARTQPPPDWDDVHRRRWAHAGPSLAAVETDSGLTLAPVLTTDSVAWFGPGFRDFALAAPDTWPALQSGGIPLVGWWRRAALAWALQSPELAHGPSRRFLLVWRRDVAERLARLAPFATFEPPSPVLADGTLRWIAYGYVHSETFPLVRSVEWDGRPARYVHGELVGLVNAASGGTRVFLAPGYDSLTAAWARLFTPLVLPPDSLPAGLRAQLPFPRQAFVLAASTLARARADSAPWNPRPREPFDLVAPGVGADGDARLWTAQGFETGAPAHFAALLAGTMSAAGPRLFLWTAGAAVRLPTALVGSPQTAPGTLRIWLAAGAPLTLQGLFAQAATGVAPPRLLQTYVSWGDHVGEGSTPTLALRDLKTSEERGVGTDTSLAGRWEAARRLAARADSALATGDLEAFGRLYGGLKQLLGVGRPKLAPAPLAH